VWHRAGRSRAIHYKTRARVGSGDETSRYYSSQTRLVIGQLKGARPACARKIEKALEIKRQHREHELCEA